MLLSSSLLENSVLHKGQVFFCMGADYPTTAGFSGVVLSAPF
jgi:hypothetical protein